MRLYYIRHGQSENNRLWMTEGSNVHRVPDPLLTDVGAQQARAVAAYLARTDSDVQEWDEPTRSNGAFGVTHCYTSLMERAVATGHAIAEALGLPLLGWRDLHELGGVYSRDPATDTYTIQPGRSRSYLASKYVRLVLPDDAGEDGWWNREHEVWEEFLPRASRVVDTLLDRHRGADDRVVLVSHGGFFSYLMRAVLAVSTEGDNPWFSLNNGSLSRIDFRDDGRVDIQYINRRLFLPAELVT